MSAQESDTPDDDLAYGGICPVCGEEFVDGFDDLEEGESYDGARVCIIEKDGEQAEALFHLEVEA